MNIARLKHSNREAGFTWRKTLILVSLGVVVGLVLALTVPIPVS